MSKALAAWGVCLFSAYAVAGTMGTPLTSPPYQFVAALQGGYANMKAGQTRTYVGTDGNNFVYFNNNGHRDKGFIGGFLGVEHALPFHALIGQLGVSYDYFGDMTSHGLHTVGNDPESSTLYQYGYQFKTQQVLAVGKVLAPVGERFYPYLSLGLGAAFNDFSHFYASTQETGTINLAPTFSSHTNSAFAYSLGAGVDASVTDHIRVGLGYRYSNFGKAEFNRGVVHFNNQIFPVPFALGASNLYAQQLFAQISYLI